MRHIIKAVKRIVEEYPDVKLVYPIHLNPKVAGVRPSQNPDVRLSRIRLFAKRIVHIYQLYTLTYIRGLTNG